jgi:hypothetical protein
MESVSPSKAAWSAVQQRASVCQPATQNAHGRDLRAVAREYLNRCHHVSQFETAARVPSCRSNGSKLEWIDRNRYLAVRRLLDGKIKLPLRPVSPTVTDMEPLHFSVRLFSPVDVVTIFSPRTYDGCCFDVLASKFVSLDFATFEFLAAYWTRALL